MADQKVFNVLFLCTHNSARSILGESIINYVGRGKFKGYSAGSHPATQPNPLAIATLKNLHLPSEGFYSKNWEEFSKPGAPDLHFVITVCDNAAREVCPVWPGQPITAHWGVEDPSLFEGTEEAEAEGVQSRCADSQAPHRALHESASGKARPPDAAEEGAGHWHGPRMR